METQELIGYYTLRNFLDESSPVNDFNKIKVLEAELFLIVENDGTITGNLSMPPEPGTAEKKILEVNGSMTRWSSPWTLEFTAGLPNTEITEFVYKYSCSPAKTWDNSVGQRLCLTGTVLQGKSIDPENQSLEVGSSTSFLAVKRDFVEPRDIPGVTIIPGALSMLASRSHRLKHTVWHTVRGVWNESWMDDESKTKIRQLGWGVDRPPFTKTNALDLTNGAGEDFLFMHRKMIYMVRDEYESKKVPMIESWKLVPRPDIPQFAYSEREDNSNPSKKVIHLDILNSGFMVPPGQAGAKGLNFLKSSDYFWSVMAQVESLFTRQSHLSGLSLGALGNLLEFTIHNQMHMRWSSISRDPKTDQPADRGDYDFDEKWDDPKYDYLGDFHSSHVNPLFWRLHGWVNDRIEGWYNAHEAAHPGEIERFEYLGFSWFKPGKWVQVENPFYWPEHHHHQHQMDDGEDITNMLKVMETIKAADPQARAKADAFSTALEARITSFMWAISR